AHLRAVERTGGGCHEGGPFDDTQAFEKLIHVRRPASMRCLDRMNRILLGKVSSPRTRFEHPATIIAHRFAEDDAQEGETCYATGRTPQAPASTERYRHHSGTRMPVEGGKE